MVTPEQHKRWMDFATRMAKTCFKHRRRPTWREILGNVEFFFQRLDIEDLKGIVDWDSSDPYPEDSPYYNRTYRCSCWHCHGAKQSNCRWDCEEGHIFDYASPSYVCDMCQEMAENWNPYYWHDINDDEWEKRNEQFCDPVECCIRAGLDMAVSPSAGVVGFTADEIRKMYPEGVPDWVTGGKDHKWLYWPTNKMNGTFAEMSNEAQLVL